jgi:phage integrase
MQKRMSFQEIDQWIEKQTNDRNYTIRKAIPGFESFILEISSKIKQKKTIRLYWRNKETGKVTYPLLGKFPYSTFEECFKKFADYVATDKTQSEKPRAIRSFREVWTSFMESNPEKFKDKTLKSYRNRSNKHILKTKLADMNINDIVLSDLEAIFNSAEEKPATNEKIFYIFRNVFKYAKKQNYIKKNILDGYFFRDHYEASSKANSRHHEKIINSSDLEDFLKNVVNSKLIIKKKILILFALETALRSMNLFDIRWKDIDFEKKLITIEKERMKGELRTLNSRRDFILPLSDTVIALLRKLKELEKIKNADLKECVFGGIGDQPLNDFLRRTAGITKHGLRGTFRTFMMKTTLKNRFPDAPIELYMAHKPVKSEVAAAYIDMRYDDDQVQVILREIAQWWDQYLLELFDFKKALLGEGATDVLQM